MHRRGAFLIIVLLPGVGQVVNNTPDLAPPEASFLGRYVGGFFIFAISLMGAYRWTLFHRDPGRTDSAAP